MFKVLLCLLTNRVVFAEHLRSLRRMGTNVHVDENMRVFGIVSITYR